MSTQTIVIIVAVLAVIAALAARGGRPRVTQIDRITTKRKPEGDER